MKKYFYLLILSVFFCGSISADDAISGFFRDYSLRKVRNNGALNQSKYPSNKIIINGHELSIFEEIDKEGNRVSSVLYGHKPLGELDGLYGYFKKLLVRKLGDSKEFRVPNFEDATERNTKIVGWKSDESILLLQEISDPSFQSVQLELHEFNSYKKSLGADYGEYVLEELDSKASEFLLSSLYKDSPVENDVKKIRPQKKPTRTEPSRDQGKLVSPGPYSKPISVSTQSDKASEPSSNFPWIIAGVLLVGILLILLKTFKGKSTS